jgi:hypothetical protein
LTWLENGCSINSAFIDVKGISVLRDIYSPSLSKFIAFCSLEEQENTFHKSSSLCKPQIGKYVEENKVEYHVKEMLVEKQKIESLENGKFRSFT